LESQSGRAVSVDRKHPIQTAFEYVHGRQVDEKSAFADIKLIYESSNGDTWGHQGAVERSDLSHPKRLTTTSSELIRRSDLLS
jgi:hypothetical protein